DLVLLGDHALGLDEVGVIRPEQEVRVVAVDQAFCEAGGGGLRAGVVEERELHLHLLAADVDAAVLRRLLEGELVALLVEPAGARLGARQRQRGTDPDRVTARGRGRRGRLSCRSGSGARCCRRLVGLLARGRQRRAEDDCRSGRAHGAYTKPFSANLQVPALSSSLSKSGISRAMRPFLLTLLAALSARAEDTVRLGNLKFAHYGAVSHMKEVCPKFGIKLEERMFAKGLDIVPGILAGEIDVAASALDGAIAGRAAGAPIYVVAGFTKGGVRIVG